MRERGRREGGKGQGGADLRVELEFSCCISWSQRERESWVERWVITWSCNQLTTISSISSSNAVALKVGSLKRFQGVPGKKGNHFFHYNSILKEHSDRMHDCFGHRVHTLSGIKYLKAKIQSDGRSWAKILSNERPWSNLCQLRGPRRESLRTTALMNSHSKSYTTWHPRIK